MISLDRIGSIGVVLAAIAAPCCFPLFAAIGTAAGLGALGQYEGIILYIFQSFALVTFIGLILAFRKHRKMGPILIGAFSCALLGYHFYAHFSFALLYCGLLGIVAATLWNYLINRRAKTAILSSIITCPKCGHRAEETMPTNACLFFYDCPACRAKLKPKPGDCCVFCSYGSVSCPPIQLGIACCK